MNVIASVWVLVWMYECKCEWRGAWECIWVYISAWEGMIWVCVSVSDGVCVWVHVNMSEGVCISNVSEEVRMSACKWVQVRVRECAWVHVSKRESVCVCKCVWVRECVCECMWARTTKNKSKSKHTHLAQAGTQASRRHTMHARALRQTQRLATKIKNKTSTGVKTKTTEKK